MDVNSNVLLSPRVCAVLSLVAKGQSNKVVARTLRITPETVKSHLKRAFAQLGSKSRAEAVVRAIELGLLKNTVPLPISSDRQGVPDGSPIQATNECVAPGTARCVECH